MIKIAVADDEMIILDSIHKQIDEILDKFGIEHEIYDYAEAAPLLGDSEKMSFDIIFLDIDMPNISGMEAAEILRDGDDEVDIIFITNKDELVYDAIKFAPFRFIRKSKFDLEIEETLNDFLAKRKKNNERHMFLTAQGKRWVFPFKIKYIEVTSHKLIIHENKETFTINGNLKDIENTFHNYGFIRIHQSYLVNYRFINLIKFREVLLDDGATLPLSRSRYEQAKIDYMHFSRES